MAGDMTTHGLREPWRNRLNSSRDACDALFLLTVARINAEEKFALFEPRSQISLADICRSMIAFDWTTSYFGER
jgi:hypothetical protein